MDTVLLDMLDMFIGHVAWTLFYWTCWTCLLDMLHGHFGQVPQCNYWTYCVFTLGKFLNIFIGHVDVHFGQVPQYIGHFAWILWSGSSI